MTEWKDLRDGGTVTLRYDDGSILYGVLASLTSSLYCASYSIWVCRADGSSHNSVIVEIVDYTPPEAKWSLDPSVFAVVAENSTVWIRDGARWFESPGGAGWMSAAELEQEHGPCKIYARYETKEDK